MKKSVFSILIHDTIGFLDQTHCVARQGKTKIVQYVIRWPILFLF